MHIFSHLHADCSWEETEHCIKKLNVCIIQQYTKMLTCYKRNNLNAKQNNLSIFIPRAKQNNIEDSIFIFK